MIFDIREPGHRASRNVGGTHGIVDSFDEVTGVDRPAIYMAVREQIGLRFVPRI